MEVLCRSRTNSVEESRQGGDDGLSQRRNSSSSDFPEEGGVVFEMAEEAKQFLLARLVIPKVLDPRTLAMCICVNRDWRQLAADEQLWENVCVAKWPSLKSSLGKKMVEGRGYCSFFATRMRLDYDHVHKMRPSEPKLQLDDLVFFLDIVYDNRNIFSMVDEGQVLAERPAATRVMHENIFRFSASLSEGIEGVIVPCSPAAPRWTKRQILEFEVTWSVVEKKTLKSVKLVQSKKGRMVGNSCIFETSLPRLSCFWHLPMLGERAEVEVHFHEEEPGFFVGRHVSMGTLNAEWCRYQSKDQALTYLEYLFSREFLIPEHLQNEENELLNFPVYAD